MRWRRLVSPITPDRGVLVLVAVLCVCLAGVQVHQAWRGHDERLARSQVETSNIARSIARYVEDTLDASAATLAATGDRLESEGFGADVVERLVQSARQPQATLPQLRGFTVIDASGRVLWRSFLNPAGDTNLADRKFFRYHHDHDGKTMLIGAPVRTKSDKIWVITATRRLSAPDGSFAGVLSVTMPISWFQHFFESFDIGTDGAISLVRDDGIVLADSPFRENEIGRDVSESPIFRQVPHDAVTNNFQVYSLLADETRLGTLQRVPRYGLFVVASRSQRAVLAPWWTATEITAAWVALAITTIVTLGVWISGQVRHRITAEAQYRLLADNSSDAIIRTGLDGTRLYVSPSFWRMTGWTSETIPGPGWSHIVDPRDHPLIERGYADLIGGAAEIRVQYRYLRPDGTVTWVEKRARTAVRVRGNPVEFVGQVRDISAQKEVEKKLAEANVELAAMTLTDPLTGVANRRHFEQSLGREWKRAMRSGASVALLMIDADAFKAYNDTYGHSAGDECLRSVAAALTTHVGRATDLVARYGGEEFAVLLPGISAHQAALLAEAIREDVVCQGIEHSRNATGFVTVSIGVAAVIPGVDASPDSLVEAADEALYEAKAAGRNKVVVAVARGSARGEQRVPHPT